LSSDATEQSASAPVLDAISMGPEEKTQINVQSSRRVAAKRIVVWLLFSAIFGLLPLFAVMMKEIMSPAGFHITSVLASGDLFIVSAVISAGALGELIAAGTKEAELVVIIAGFFCLAAFAGNTLAFVFAGNAKPSEIVAISLWFFPATLIASGLCVGTAAYR